VIRLLIVGFVYATDLVDLESQEKRIVILIGIEEVLSFEPLIVFLMHRNRRGGMQVALCDLV
jgi:hypothetical protein